MGDSQKPVGRLMRELRRRRVFRAAALHVVGTWLGMIGAAAAAVNCIRAGLREPSYVMPFIEPHLPFYDPIRETPEFQALVAELQ